MTRNMTARTMSADDRKQPAGHEFAGLGGVSIAEEDEQDDREDQRERPAKSIVRENQPEGDEGGQGARRPGEERCSAAGLEEADQSTRRQQHGVDPQGD